MVCYGVMVCIIYDVTGWDIHVIAWFITYHYHRVESRFLLSHSKLKSPTISTHFQRPLKELEKPISAARRRRQNVDGFSNEKRRRGSITHPLKSAIQRSRASPSEVRQRWSPSPCSSSSVSPCASPCTSPCVSLSADSERKNFARKGNNSAKYQTV